MPTPIPSNQSTLSLMHMIKNHAKVAQIKLYIEQEKLSIEWDKVNIIHYAISCDFVATSQLLDFLVNSKIYPIDTLDYNGHTPLQALCFKPGDFQSNKFYPAKYLVDNGADVNRLNSLAQPPAYGAITVNAQTPALLELLLSHGASPNFICPVSNTSYIEHCILNLFKYSYDDAYGAQINTRTPLIEMLLKHGASLINPQTKANAQTLLDKVCHEKLINQSNSERLDKEAITSTQALLLLYKEKRQLEEHVPLDSPFTRHNYNKI